MVLNQHPRSAYPCLISYSVIVRDCTPDPRRLQSPLDEGDTVYYDFTVIDAYGNSLGVRVGVRVLALS
jgi:hypothetical protein